MNPRASGAPPGRGEARVAAGLGSAETQVDDASSLPQSTSPYATRRRFLILAAMAGWVQPERVTERILAELAGEASQ
jgi:hypothetical protein